MQSPLGFFFAFVIVLALIGGAAWAVRRFAGNRLGATAKGGRLPRLAVIDAAAVDNRRRLVLVRRDNVEHLLMIGGPTDIVVEPNIVRAAPAREAPRSMPEPTAWADDAPRAESLDLNEPALTEPSPPPIRQRPSFVEEARRAAAAPERREIGSRDIGGFPAEPMLRPPPEARAEPPVRSGRTEPMMPRPSRNPERGFEPKPPPMRTERVAPPVVPPAPSPTPASADQNLAEMAQRLEAALRSPADRPTAPPMAPDAPAVRTPRAASEASAAPSVTPQKAAFEDLEEEMASLLGRPKNTT